MRHPARDVAALVVALVIAAAIAAAAPPPAAATMVTETYTGYSTAKGVGQTDIAGDCVVWADKNTAGVSKIGWGTIDTTANDILPWPSPPNPGAQTHPAVWGDWIVWQDHRNGNWDIYGRSYSVPGTDVALCTAKGDQTLPRIFGTDVVWQDHRGKTWDIYSQDVAAPAGNATPVVVAKGDQTAPDINGGPRIVWVDTRSGNADIWIRLPGPVSKALTTNRARQDQPTIGTNRVVWRDFRKAPGNGTDLYLCDLSGGTTKAVVTAAGNQSAPHLSDDMIVYNDYRSAALGKKGYGADIGFYDITLLEDSDIVAAKGTQKSPAIWGGTVLWTDGGVPASKPDSIQVAELTFWSAYLSINSYEKWTNDPLVTLDFFAAHKNVGTEVAVTDMTVDNVGAVGPFPYEAYVTSKAAWNLNGGLVDTDGLKQVEVGYRDFMLFTSPVVRAAITLDRGFPAVSTTAPVKCRSGGAGKIRFKIDDTLSPKASVKITIRKKGTFTTIKTLSVGWVPTDAWRTRSFACTLKPGKYSFVVLARDLAGNTPLAVALNDLTVTK